MDKNLQIAQAVLEKVGGKENVTSVMHCITRLRFNLKDNSKVDDEGIKKIPGVMGTTTGGGMYMVIVGNAIEKVYYHLCKLGEFETQKSLDENLDNHQPQKPSAKKILDNVIAYVSGCMTGVLPILVGAAMCKTIATIIGPSVFNLVSDTSDLFVMLNFLYNAFFYFLPIYIGYTACKVLNMNPIYGLFIGAMLLVPDFINLVGVRDTFSIFGIPVPVANYSQSFLPTVLGCWLMSYVYKIFKKIIPDVLATIFVPTLTMLVMVVLMFVVCAPIGTRIGEGLSAMFMFFSGAHPVIRIIGSIALCALLPYMVLFGMHSAIFVAAYVSFVEVGFDVFVWPLGVAYSFVIYGVALGAFIKFKKKENKALASGYFLTGILSGLSEPTLYGICLKYKSAMKALLFGCIFAGAISGIFQPKAYVFGGTANIFGAFTYWPAGGVSNLIWGAVLVVGSLVVGVLSTLLFARFEND